MRLASSFLVANFATRGTPLATPVFAFLLGYRFQSFDELVAGIEDAIPDIHAQVELTCRNQGDTDAAIVIAGWSCDRNRPEAYLIRTTEREEGATLEETAAVMAGAIQPPPYKLHALGSVTYAPFCEQAGIFGGAAAAWPLAASAQQSALLVIGFLHSASLTPASLMRSARD